MLYLSKNVAGHSIPLDRNVTSKARKSPKEYEEQLICEKRRRD